MQRIKSGSLPHHMDFLFRLKGIQIKEIASEQKLWYITACRRRRSRQDNYQKEILMNIYVGNLSREATEDDLKQAFEAFGKVDTAAIIKDKVSGESKGFGFIEMPELAEAQAAMTELNGKDLKGRAMTVNEAKPRTDNKKSGGRGGFGGGNRY